MRLLPVPEDIAVLASEFTAWRSGRPHLRSPIPDELMLKAAQAATVHTVNVVAKSIKIDRRRLGAVLGRRPAESPRVTPASPAAATGVRLAQVMLPAMAPAPANVVVEITDPAGWRLSVSCVDAAGLVKAFVEGRR
jgi:hypothetical protein